MVLFIVRGERVDSPLEFLCDHRRRAVHVLHNPYGIALGPYAAREASGIQVAPVERIRYRRPRFNLGNDARHKGTVHVVFAEYITDIVDLV